MSRAFTVKLSDIQRCRIHSLSPEHYREDGTCRCGILCRHCGHEIWENPKGSPSERWTDNRSDTAFLGSGFICPVNMRHEPEEQT